ncbi:NAD(P)H-dependent flavin oxidoreductase [Geodermatophilus obscurus]|uniref:2-nitropropane dioxygenase NPD n=1 Tax=Geodermatophilus obscurus (strain ATCC 25078 / DSM 43160 / JCM 3152 / CCUG 61914 / KCC A-0152 / KCTC 9177 / NBRC 13315 / NRRL B-3577 / G-20) TaxID=526225 RepID=D2SCK8_GEOOG|nr:nitronate monooxygenase [Geodermatophilus obscurus]ADB76336.1 2-nitropropane dioxygenase NPD [Geodermatophilus obscurus DSM 43160]
MRTRFTELVGCSVPIQQAPMGTISSPDLAVAVADAGGVGTVTALGLPPEVLVRRLDEMGRRTSGVLSANVVSADVGEQVVVDVGEQVVVDVAERVRLVDFFWFDPSPRLVDLVHRSGALAGWQVGSVAEARAAEDAGCDVVTVQGVEAGGHVRGAAPLRRLLPEVLDAVDVPVLAAGGIADGRSFAEVVAAGAAGARIGTRFLATVESGAHPAYKQAVVDAAEDCTVITDAFADCPLCATSPRARVLRSAVERVGELEDDVVGTAVMGRARVPVPRGSGLPPVAGAEGHLDAMAMYAGAAVGSVTDIRPAAEVVAELVAELDRRRPGLGSSGVR